MSKKTRLSHAQKRKQKLAKRSRRQPQDESLAYTGDKHKSPELVQSLFETEKAILTAYVGLRREPTDEDVARAITKLIGDLRSRPAADLMYTDDRGGESSVEASIISIVLQDWKSLHEVRVL